MENNEYNATNNSGSNQTPNVSSTAKSDSQIANEIKNSSWLDIVFRNRNKKYGAYSLRKTYSQRLLKALGITFGIAVVVFAIVLLSSTISKATSNLDVTDVEMSDVKTDEPPPPTTPPPPPPPPPAAPPPPPVNTIKFTAPKIVKDEEATKPIEEVKDDANIGKETVKSDNTTAVVAAPPPVEQGSGVQAAPPPVVEEDKLFTKVEIEAAFPGGLNAWRTYLERKLDAQVPVNNGAPPGVHTVIVRFEVDKSGNISNVTCESDPGFGMCQEAIRVIKAGPKWTPGQQNGTFVRSIRRQPIGFNVLEE